MVLQEGLPEGGFRAYPDFVTLSQKIRLMLHEAPATEDIADEVGLSMRRAQVVLWVLKRAGHAETSGLIRREGKCKQPLRLVQLTRRGEIALKRSLPATGAAATGAASRREVPNG